MLSNRHSFISASASRRLAAVTAFCKSGPQTKEWSGEPLGTRRANDHWRTGQRRVLWVKREPRICVWRRAFFMFWYWFAFSNKILGQRKTLNRFRVLMRITFGGEAAGLHCDKWLRWWKHRWWSVRNIEASNKCKKEERKRWTPGGGTLSKDRLFFKEVKQYRQLGGRYFFIFKGWLRNHWTSK